jgi:proline iminopeptidase
MNRSRAFSLVVVMLAACTPPEKPVAQVAASSPARSPNYFDHTGRTDVLSGGARRIAITTPNGPSWVWTKRVGNSPRIKVLLLHGGPGATHEYFEAFDSYFPAAGIEYYYYDQLGSAFSDQPEMSALLSLPRFVDEVEQVRQALGLGPENFYLLGHSWGGILAIEYALAHPEALRGLVISNMMASIPEYNRYAREVLEPQIDPAVLAEVKALEAAGDTANPRYLELLMPHHYVQHILRMPLEQWPDPVHRAFDRINPAVYVPMQGPSELGASGILVDWDRVADLPKIAVPTLVIGARHDTMDPAHMERMAAALPRGRLLMCEQGSHMAMYDDQQAYFDGLLAFLADVDAGQL